MSASGSSCDDQRLADAVDGCELGDPLTRFRHEARVLERDGEAARERRQQPLVVLAERMLTVDVLERDHTHALASRHERDEEDRPR